MMIFRRIDLQQKLEAYRDRKVFEGDILEQVQAVLRQDQEKEDGILERLKEENPDHSNALIFELLEANRIFHLSHIEKLCITYRLRFLDARFFKSSLPVTAIQEIKHLQKKHGTQLQGFKIMAPSKHFKLENADDPILFAPLGNNYFYLIHKWGNDLHPLRKLMVWPLRSFENLGIFVFLVSFLITLIFREIFYTQYRATSEFIMLYLFTFKSVFGIIIFYGIALGKNFNTCIWQSKYSNA